MSTLKDRLRQALNDSPHLTQGELARYCGVSPASVTKWLDGRTKNLEGANLIRAAKLLRISPMWLAEGRGPMRSSGEEDGVSESIELRDWLSVDEVELLEVYGRLLPEKQRVFMRFVRTFMVGAA